MVHSNNLDEILISYILNESNTQQELFVRNWLSKSETNRLYFEQLVRTSGLVEAVGKNENIDIGHEWSVFKKSRDAYENALAFKNISIEQNVELGSLSTPRSSRRDKYIFLAAAAACIMVMLSFGWKYFINSSTADHLITRSEIKAPATRRIFERHEVNNSGSTKHIILKDGSIISLSEKSEVRFSEPFEEGKRDIFLIGKAGFKVAKDQSRPFTVFSGDISTTALGTEFTVTAFKNAENITVRLFEGKVVIKSTITAKMRLKKNLYLRPGQQLVYNIRNASAFITTFRRSGGQIIKPENNINEHLVIDNPNIPLHDAGSWFMFNNQSLSQVFDQLEGLYNIEIIYNKKDLQKRYFIGKFEKTDSLQHVLQMITSLNGLVSEKKKNAYYISKQK